MNITTQNPLFIYRYFRRLYRLIRNYLIKLFMFTCNRIIGVSSNKIVFRSFGGKTYSDNPKAISEKMHEMYPNFELVWLFNEPEKKRKIVPHYIKIVRNRTIYAIFELATSKFWVDNFQKEHFLYKSREQVYIQTWHGDRGFKKKFI